MPKPKWPAAMLVGSLFVALLAGLAYFADWATPSSYPEMSSLNAGPKGAKLLFEALSNTPPMLVSRNFLPLSQWHPSSTTILFFGLSPNTLNLFDKNDLVDLEQLSGRGNRVVLSVKNNKPGFHDLKKNLSIKTRWGIQISPSPSLDRDSSWQPLNGLSDAVEKHLPNGGTLVVTLNGDDLSNEILATAPEILNEIPPLLGKNNSVSFDETHLGITEAGSVASLARRFHLQGLIAGLLLLVALFIWNQSVSFPPPPRFETSHDTQVVGADARGMFAGLLARYLTPDALLESCISEWNRVKPQQRITAEIASKMDPVAAYRQLQETLPKKRSRI